MYPTKNAPSDLHSNIYAHPEWPKFSKWMRDNGFDVLKINQAWGYLLGGLQTEERLRAAGQGNQDNNPEYKALAELFAEELKITPGTSLALWSGGIGVSDYAAGKGHTTLEVTKAGKALMQVELHKNWKLQAPLWNTISRAFVNHPSLNVHIYLRAWQPSSVLIRQEVPGLRALETALPSVQLHWHALYTDENDVTKEIDRNGRLVDEFVYRQRDLCVAALSKYLTYINTNDQNIAAKEMKALLEDNLRRTTTN